MNPLRPLPLWLALSLLGLALVTGACQREESKPAAAAAPEEEAVEGPDELNAELAAKLAERQKGGRTTKGKPKPTTPEPVVRALKAGEQWCFECQHTGAVPCRADGCNAGYVRCPGACVQLGRGNWVPDPNHPGQLGLKFRTSPNSSAIISLAHIGDVFGIQNGKAVYMGPCPTCKGTAKVRCTTCDATGKLACPVCKGAQVVPASWKATDNPWFNAQADLVRLKDGRVFLGKESGGDGESVIFKTRDGKFITVPKADIVASPAGP